MIGSVVTTAIYPDGRREIIEEDHNLVVNSAYVAMAMAAKAGDAFFGWWAVGDGDGSTTAVWDAGVADGSIKPTTADAALSNEIYRKQILPADMAYLDSAGAVSATPTSRIQITVTFNENEPATTAYFREWGIFGGDASATSGSGRMVNRRVHATYEKTNAVKLERKLKFSF